MLAAQKDAMKTSEENLIARIRRRIPSSEGGVLPVGIGDDAAVLRAPAAADRSARAATPVRRPSRATARTRARKNTTAQLSDLPGGAHQCQLGLLACKIGVQELQPLVVLLKLSGFEIAQTSAALAELGLDDAGILLRQVQFQAGHF
ncbi:MAG: hypothetical protein ACHP79_14665, partial [Terriglobales bacterium]